MASASTGSSVEIVQSGSGSEFGGRFAGICVSSPIKYEYRELKSPRWNGFIEHTLSTIDSTQLVVRTKAEKLLPQLKAPMLSSVWREAIKYVVNSMNRAVTRSNLDYVSPGERY